MKKLTSTLFLLLLLSLCAFLAVGFFLHGPSAAGSNEILSQKPALDADVLENTAKYYSDRFYLRQELITAHNKLLSALFGVSGESSVLLGQDGWLYYADTLDDYTGADPLTDAELARAAENLSLLQESCEKAGARFLFTVAPNKNSLYGENMPAVGTVSAVHDAQRLFIRLDEAGVNYLDLFSLFKAQPETLYFAHDSHWNGKGAALAADRINAFFGVDSDYFSGNFEKERHDGDLYAMAYPAAEDGEYAPAYRGEADYTYDGKATAPDSIRLTTHGGGELTLLCYRDSFGNLLHPYLAASFKDALFSRSVSYELTDAAEYDCVVIELVERNLRYLLQNVPKMAAPAREIDLPSESFGTCPAEFSEKDGLCRGTLDESAEVVYLICGGTAYEAFLLENGAFAAYLPGRAEYAAAVIDGELMLFSAEYTK